MAPALAAPLAGNSFDVINFAVREGHGAKGLADLGLQTLPKQYIQPAEELITSSTIVSSDTIQVIDMSDLTNPQVAKSICDAAANWGFFQIINHGIPKQVLDDVKEATHKFFALPAEIKNKNSKENTPTNNVRYGTSFLPELEKPMEWKDSLSLFYVSEEETSTLWPSVCRKEVIDYMKQAENVARKLLEALMKGLGIAEMDEAKESLLMGSRRIILNYYPKCPQPELTVGVGRHSDVSTLTMLLQDDVGGLYVKKSDTEDEWIPVTPIDGAIVVNVGDALQILSNGKYKSIEHRVTANSSTGRISVPVFVNPRPTDIIKPLPEVVQNGEKPIYKEVLYSDYVKHFYRKAHDGKDTLDLVQI